MSDELKPCPFCGSANVGIHVFSTLTVSVECKSCFSQGAVADAEPAIRLWNTRPVAAWASDALTTMHDSAAALATAGDHEQAARLLTCINAYAGDREPSE
jgi:Lar family restriction alleviation protein